MGKPNNSHYKLFVNTQESTRKSDFLKIMILEAKSNYQASPRM